MQKQKKLNVICTTRLNTWYVQRMALVQHASNGKFNGKSMARYSYNTKLSFTYCPGIDRKSRNNNCSLNSI